MKHLGESMFDNLAIYLTTFNVSCLSNCKIWTYIGLSFLNDFLKVTENNLTVHSRSR
jgi:hypothetical protein